MKPFLSVVIPTYNRVEKLEKTLQKLFEQTLAKAAYEVWVVNDGSTDGTEELLREWSQKEETLHCIHQKNSGQGVARNHALQKIQGELVLFMGDDIYASPDFLKTHADFHKDYPEENKACLGLTEWEGHVSPFMQWLTHGGPQFAYDQLKPNQSADFWFFYTSNLSLKTSLLQKECFDEDFRSYGWEDIELGYRLQKKYGLELVYLPSAWATHEHPMEEKDLERKMLGIGKTAKIFQKKHPELQVIPKGTKKMILRCIASRPSIFLLTVLAPILGSESLWWAKSKRYFLEGVKGL